MASSYDVGFDSSWFDREGIAPENWFDDEMDASSASGTAYTLTGSPAAFAVTGKAATLPVHRVLSATPGSVTVNGPTAPAHYTLIALPAGGAYGGGTYGSGAYGDPSVSITGVVATLTHGAPSVVPSGGDDWSPAYQLSAAMLQQKLQALPQLKRQVTLLDDEEAQAELDDLWGVLALMADL